MQHNPAQVSQWLSSMLNIIPGDILSLLAQRVKSHQIGGHTFSGMLNNHEFFNEMGIEGLTMLHCSKIRKVWHQDFPETRNVTLDKRPPGGGPHRGGQPGIPGEMQGSMPVAGMRPPGGRNPTSRMYQEVDDDGPVSRMNATQHHDPRVSQDPRGIVGDPRMNTTYTPDLRRGLGDETSQHHREESLRMAQQLQKMRADMEILERKLSAAEEQRDNAINRVEIVESRNRALESQVKELLDVGKQVFERVCDQAGLDKAKMYPGSRDLIHPHARARPQSGGGAGQPQGQGPAPRGDGANGAQGRSRVNGGGGGMNGGGAQPRNAQQQGQMPGQPQLGGRIVGDPFDPNAPPVQVGASQRGGGKGAPQQQQRPPQGPQGYAGEGEKRPPPQQQQRPANPFDELPASAHHRTNLNHIPPSDPSADDRTSSSRGAAAPGAASQGIPAASGNGRFNPSFDESEELRDNYSRVEEKASSQARGGPGAPGRGGQSSSVPKYGGQQQQGGSSSSSAVNVKPPKNNKSPGKVIDWIKSLPDAFVPENIRDQMCGNVDMKGIDGTEFTQLVMQNQLSTIGVVSPLQISKIVKAWKNVLAEDQMSDAAKQNFDNQPTGKKAVKLIC